MAQGMGLNKQKPHVHMTQLEYAKEETYPKFT
jgi:hypothetical protein